MQLFNFNGILKTPFKNLFRKTEKKIVILPFYRENTDQKNFILNTFHAVQAALIIKFLLSGDNSIKIGNGLKKD